MSSALTVLIAPFITNWVTSLIKHTTPLSDQSALAIRAVLAIIAVIMAIGEAWLGGALPTGFEDLVGVAILAVLNFLGATGIFHLGTAKA